jgi:hypothetical protein
MNRILLTAFAASLLLVPALRSSAQYGDEPTPKISVKLGVYSPFGTKFRDNIKSLWRNMGLEYAVRSDELGRPSLVASVMATSSQSDLVQASMTSLQCEKRWYANQKEGGSSLYYAGGLGYYMLKTKSRDDLFRDFERRTGGKLGVTGALGYQYKESGFGEVRLNYSGELSNGLDFSGISVNLGMKMAF